MNRFVFAAAFAVGAIAIIWIGRLFIGAEPVGLVVTALIAVVYLIGALELLAFRRATISLQTALRNTNEPVLDLPAWLEGLAPVLRNSVQARIETGRVGLPAPTITPYLVGLLVMLGLLGTFIGMVDTLKGAVVALEGSSELEAIREGLASPIEGLGLAFGTSVAGVAASAMLGLLSTLSRRERMQVTQLLDGKTASHLSQYSASHQQRMAFQAIERQAMALPNVAETLNGLASKLETLGDQIGERLLENQSTFQSNINEQYTQLNHSFNESLKGTLIDSVKSINQTLEPITARALEALLENAKATQATLIELSDQQQQNTAKSVEKIQQNVAQNVEQNSTLQAKATAQLVDQVDSSINTITVQLQAQSDKAAAALDDAAQTWVAEQKVAAKSVAEVMQSELNALREQESARGETAVERLTELQSAVTEHLLSLGQALEAPMTRLIETASETPKAAADVIEKLRGEISKNIERDNELLAERTRLLEQFDTMSQSLQTSSDGQREAVDALIESSSQTLSELGSQFAEQVQGEAGRLGQVAEHFAASSADMASMGDAFAAAVGAFSESNKALMDKLDKIEAAMEKSNSRSDEQLAYYVAQAREIIDHNLLSHQQIINAIKADKPVQLAVNEVS